MRKYIQNSLLTTLFLSVSISAYAANQPATASNALDPQITTTIKTNLQKNLPDLTIDQVVATPFAGVYEVDSGRKVFYVDGTGNYALIGNLLDLKTKDSLTEQRTNDLNVIDWKKLPTSIAIQKIVGNGANKIAIFTDPDCPFCKRLEAETVSKLNNVTIYYFLYPLPIHPNATNDSKKILCAENPESALQSFMAKDKPLGKNITCNNASNLTTMQSVGANQVQVTGTPTIILPNGKIISGLVPADYLSRAIDTNRAESSM